MQRNSSIDLACGALVALAVAFTLAVIGCGSEPPQFSKQFARPEVPEATAGIDDSSRDCADVAEVSLTNHGPDPRTVHYRIAEGSNVAIYTFTQPPGRTDFWTRDPAACVTTSASTCQAPKIPEWIGVDGYDAFTCNSSVAFRAGLGLEVYYGGQE